MWREIKDFPNYHINKFGHIYNVITKRFLKQLISGKYYFVYLHNRGVRKHFYVHRLVCQSFNERRGLNHNNVDHIDRNTLNNHYTNLRYCSQAENTINRAVKGSIVKNKLSYRAVFRNYNHNTKKIEQLSFNSIFYTACLYQLKEWRKLYGDRKIVF